MWFVIFGSLRSIVLNWRPLQTQLTLPRTQVYLLPLLLVTPPPPPPPPPPPLRTRVRIWLTGSTSGREGQNYCNTPFTLSWNLTLCHRIALYVGIM